MDQTDHPVKLYGATLLQPLRGVSRPALQGKPTTECGHKRTTRSMEGSKPNSVMNPCPGAHSYCAATTPDGSHGETNVGLGPETLVKRKRDHA
jgi:hypothetical protein